MSPRSLIIVTAVALATLVVGSQPAQAQDRFDFKIPFSFVAAGKTFPAGSYSFLVNQPNRDLVVLESNEPKTSSAALPVETRISTYQSLKEAELVFDKVENQSIVSELLVPGEDGYLLRATSGAHTHTAVKGSRAKK